MQLYTPAMFIFEVVVLCLSKEQWSNYVCKKHVTHLTYYQALQIY